MSDPGKASSEDEYIEIRTRIRRDEVIDTSKVPKEWYDHRERVYDIQETLVDRYLDRPEVYNISITKQDRGPDDAGIVFLRILVELDDMDFASEIPDRIEDVEIKKIKAKHRHRR